MCRLLLNREKYYLLHLQCMYKYRLQQYLMNHKFLKLLSQLQYYLLQLNYLNFHFLKQHQLLLKHCQHHHYLQHHHEHRQSLFHLQKRLILLLYL